jgi:tetrahydrodipicolinate N-succinyltransferase
MTVSAGGAGVVVVVEGELRAVVVIGLDAVVGSRSNTWGMEALATAMASAGMVKGEATQGRHRRRQGQHPSWHQE